MKSVELSQIICRLEENNLVYRIVELHNSSCVIVTERGGRIFGPFENKKSPGIFWINSAFSDADNFKAFLTSNNWNIGGDRIWVAPEIPFFTKNRRDFFSTTSPQSALDPGQYILKDALGGVRLSQHVKLKVYESILTEKKFYIDRLVRPISNPLHSLSQYNKLMLNVTFCGYQQLVTLVDESPQDPMYLEAWNLSQVKSGGKVYIPFNGVFEYVNYYEQIDDNIQTKQKGCIVLSATGKRRFKVGYPSAIVTGRLAYLFPLDEERYCLYIKNFNNNPSSVYCCEPFDQPGETGCSLFVYNDNGELGGFAELENTFQTVGGDTQLTKTTDYVENWFYFGDRENLIDIANTFIGCIL